MTATPRPLRRSLSSASAIASASGFTSITLLIPGPCLSISSIRAKYFSVIDRAVYFPDIIPVLQFANRNFVQFKCRDWSRCRAERFRGFPFRVTSKNGRAPHLTPAQARPQLRQPIPFLKTCVARQHSRSSSTFQFASPLKEFRADIVRQSIASQHLRICLGECYSANSVAALMKRKIRIVAQQSLDSRRVTREILIQLNFGEFLHPRDQKWLLAMSV